MKINLLLVLSLFPITSLLVFPLLSHFLRFYQSIFRNFTSLSLFQRARVWPESRSYRDKNTFFGGFEKGERVNCGDLTCVESEKGRQLTIHVNATLRLNVTVENPSRFLFEISGIVHFSRSIRARNVGSQIGEFVFDSISTIYGLLSVLKSGVSFFLATLRDKIIRSSYCKCANRNLPNVSIFVKRYNNIRMVLNGIGIHLWQVSVKHVT